MSQETTPQSEQPERIWECYYEGAVEELRNQGIEITQQNLIRDWGLKYNHVPYNVDQTYMTEVLLAYNETSKRADHIKIVSTGKLLEQLGKGYQKKLKRIRETDNSNLIGIERLTNLVSLCLSDNPQSFAGIIVDLGYEAFKSATIAASKSEMMKGAPKEEHDRLLTRRKGLIEYQAYCIAHRRFFLTQQKPNE